MWYPHVHLHLGASILVCKAYALWQHILYNGHWRSALASGSLRRAILHLHFPLALCWLTNDDVASAHVRDIFGILSNALEWEIFCYKQGSSIVEYERYELSACPKGEPKIYSAQFQKLMSALIGIMMHQPDVGS